MFFKKIRLFTTFNIIWMVQITVPWYSWWIIFSENWYCSTYIVVSWIIFLHIRFMRREDANMHMTPSPASIASQTPRASPSLLLFGAYGPFYKLNQPSKPNSLAAQSICCWAHKAGGSWLVSKICKRWWTSRWNWRWGNFVGRRSFFSCQRLASSLNYITSPQKAYSCKSLNYHQNLNTGKNMFLLGEKEGVRCRVDPVVVQLQPWQGHHGSRIAITTHDHAGGIRGEEEGAR